MSSPVPRYVKFARSLALLGSLATLSCGDDAKQGDTSKSDSDVTDGETVDCSTCDCAASTPDPTCYDACCFVVGPLYPPDLPDADLPVDLPDDLA